MLRILLKNNAAQQKGNDKLHAKSLLCLLFARGRDKNIKKS